MTVFAERMINGGIAAVLAWALLMPLAHAAPLNSREFREGVREGIRQDNSQKQLQPNDQRDARRPFFQRRDNAEEQRPQRLSPDERRQLRRDIKDAGREIYRQRR